VHSLAEIAAFGKSTIKSSIARPRLIWELAPDPGYAALDRNRQMK
jgi:hypothetical protein